MLYVGVDHIVVSAAVWRDLQFTSESYTLDAASGKASTSCPSVCLFHPAYTRTHQEAALSILHVCLSHRGIRLIQGSHYHLMLKFKDFSRTFKDPQVAFSRTNFRRKFRARAVEQYYLIYISVMTVQLYIIKH